MKQANLKEITVDQLVAHFVALALEEGEVIYRETPRYNRLFRRMEDVRGELKSRHGDQRRALIPLLQHPNAQVRIKSALTTLALVPEASRLALQIINDRKEWPQAADA